MFAMFCQVDKFDPMKLVIFVVIRVWECALDWFTMAPVYKCLLDICRFKVQGQHILIIDFVDPYVQIIPN